MVIHKHISLKTIVLLGTIKNIQVESLQALYLGKNISH
jgi:hypothetical protein